MKPVLSKKIKLIVLLAALLLAAAAVTAVFAFGIFSEPSEDPGWENVGADENAPSLSASIVHGEVLISARYTDTIRPCVEGTTTNLSSETVDSLVVTIEIVNENNEVIDDTWTSAVEPGGLAPGQTARWQVPCLEGAGIKLSIAE